MSSKLTVLMYHYIRDFQKTDYPRIKGLDVRDFHEQVLYLKKHYNILSIEEIIYSIENNVALPQKAAILTFDDGYADHYDYALPILDKYNIKGSFYIPAKTIEEKKVLDVNKIHFILAIQTNISEIIIYLQEKLLEFKDKYNLKSFEYYYSKLAIANRFDHKDIIFIKRLLQVELDEALRNHIVDELFTKTLRRPEDAFSQELYLTKNQITEMVSAGMHIGSHGYEHYWWNHLTKEELKVDLNKSLGFLDSIGVNMKNWTACYPYGSYSEDAIKILKEKNCKLAFTTKVAVANLQSDNLLLIPRLDTNDLPKDSRAEKNKWYFKG